MFTRVEEGGVGVKLEVLLTFLNEIRETLTTGLHKRCRDGSSTNDGTDLRLRYGRNN